MPRQAKDDGRGSRWKTTLRYLWPSFWTAELVRGSWSSGASYDFLSCLVSSPSW